MNDLQELLEVEDAAARSVRCRGDINVRRGQPAQPMVDSASTRCFVLRGESEVNNEAQ